MGETDLRRGLKEARESLKNGKLREALARLFHLTEKYPEDREVKGEIAVALLRQGHVHADRGKMEQARDDFERSIRYSETAEGHVSLGRIYQSQGEFDDAFAEYTRALDLNENLPVIHECLGYYFLEIQDFEQAVKAFGNALSVGATDRDVYVGLWKAHMAQERLDRAHETIAEAVQKMPNDDVLLTLAGLTASMRHEGEKALEWWARAVLVNPRNVDAHFYLAGEAARQGRRTDALKGLRKCASIDTERTQTLWKQDARQPHSRFGTYHQDEDFLDAIG